MPDFIKETLGKVISKKRASKEEEEEIVATDAINKKRREVEIVAKNDSISGANKAKLKGANIYIQKREGNQEANKTRTSSGNPTVQLYKNPHQYSTYEKHTGEKDNYIREGKLEKEMPFINTGIVDKTNKSTKAFIKPTGKLASK